MEHVESKYQFTYESSLMESLQHIFCGLSGYFYLWILLSFISFDSFPVYTLGYITFLESHIHRYIVDNLIKLLRGVRDYSSHSFACLFSLMQQLTQELEQDETRSFRHQVGSPVTNSPPGR